VAAPAPAELVTIIEPVRIRIPYGETIIPIGAKLPVVSRNAMSVRVRYLGDSYDIPLGSTDLR
jgi:hypothetical protein